MRGRYFHVGDAEFISDEGEEFKLLYYIGMEEIAYCIKVERVAQDGSLTTEESQGITSCLNEAEDLVKTLVQWAITPVCLLGVIDDLMGA